MNSHIETMLSGSATAIAVPRVAWTPSSIELYVETLEIEVTNPFNDGN